MKAWNECKGPSFRTKTNTTISFRRINWSLSWFLNHHL
eukprot:03335.XXX_35261_35374_1 [CDS] Oithona nana genome sequencing.